MLRILRPFTATAVFPRRSAARILPALSADALLPTMTSGNRSLVGCKHLHTGNRKPFIFIIVRLATSVPLWSGMILRNSCSKAVSRSVLLFAIVVASSSIGRCDTVQFAVPPADVGAPFNGGSVDLFSSGLNGTVLTGQSLSLDLVLSDDVLARVYANDPDALGVELAIYTTATTAPGFAGPTTGFLLDPSGNQFGDTLTAGRDDGSDGSFGMGLNLFTPQDLESENVFDLSGAEFDTSLPSTGYTVTDAELIFSLNSNSNAVQFGTAQQLPEPSTFGLTFLGLLAIALAARRKGSKRPSLPCS
ncbi:MAG: PEP-CTERM sorting domain-containing protein [Candidatus Acidiferrales bacterium]